MLDSGVLGVVIGLILVYFLLSLLCSGLNELVEAFLRRRARYLEAGILDLLGATLKDQLYAHHVIDALSPQKGKPDLDLGPRDRQKARPAYIPSRSFSQALSLVLTDPSTKLTGDISETETSLPVAYSLPFNEDDTVQVGPERMRVIQVAEKGLEVERGRDDTTALAHKTTAIVTRVRDEIPDADEILADLQTTINKLPSGRLREALSGFLTAGGVTLDRWRAQVERWFDDKMDRVSGWYTRRTRVWLLLFALGVVVFLNADSVLFARTLWQDATVRDAVVAQARLVTESGGERDPCEDPACVAERLQDVKALNLPLGWPDLRVGDWSTSPAYVDDDRVPRNGAEWGLKVLGLLLTAAALTLGANFWFDLLNKVTNLRAAGRPPQRADQIEAATGTEP